MRNISVPTNDMMIFAVHGNTVDECIADCAKLMAYLTKGAQPENDTVDDDDDYNSDDYDDYELDDDDTVDDDDDTAYRYYYCDGYDDRVPSDEIYRNKEDCINAAYENLKNSRIYKEYYRDYLNDCSMDNMIGLNFENWFYSLVDDDDELLYIEKCKFSPVNF
jgi:hypothetical protein